jgi:hypothetical protein
MCCSSLVQISSAKVGFQLTTTFFQSEFYH